MSSDNLASLGYVLSGLAGGMMAAGFFGRNPRLLAVGTFFLAAGLYLALLTDGV
jgi:hypothetical protein